MTASEKIISFPPKFYDFANAAMATENRKRFLVIHGGRAGGKTQSCAKLLLFLATQKAIRILCCREIMSSIDMSVYQVLCDMIREMNLSYFFDVEKHAIYGRNDPDREKCSQIKFAGLKTNIDSVRSMEGLDIVWLEECHDISTNSLRTLLPTVRKKDSQLWFTYNPRFASDPIHQKFVVDGDEDALVIKMDYIDNPFIEQTSLVREINKLRDNDYEEYMHVYMGATLSVTEGAVLAKEIKQAETEKHFRHVPYDPSAGVEAFWDMGFADSMVIILAQRIPGGEVHVIDCIENSQQPVGWYLEQIRQRENVHQYRVKKHFLPHDAKARSYTSGLSAEELIRNAGNAVQIIPKVSVPDGINAVRAMFHNLWFDDRNCAELITNLRLYRYEINTRTIDGVPRLKADPVHDHSSHFFDALKYLCLALKPPKVAPPRGTGGVPQPNWGSFVGQNGWMKSL